MKETTFTVLDYNTKTIRTYRNFPIISENRQKETINTFLKTQYQSLDSIELVLTENVTTPEDFTGPEIIECGRRKTSKEQLDELRNK